MLAERALGADWESAATRANAAAAIAVTRKGTESAPTRAEVDEFQRGWIDAIAPRFDALSIDDVLELRRLLSLVRPADRSRR